MFRTMIFAAMAAAPPLGAAASTTTLLHDDFAAEVAGGPTQAVNFSPLANRDIVDGSVDLFTNGGFGLRCGSGGCLDLDGTSPNATRLESKTTFGFVAGGNYALRIFLSGKNGSNPESPAFDVIGGGGASYFSPTGPRFADVAGFSFLAASDFSGKLFIDHAGGDNFGLLRDRVTLTERLPETAPIPLPAGLPLLLGGFLGLGALRRRARWRARDTRSAAPVSPGLLRFRLP